MATFEELVALRRDPVMQQRVAIGCLVDADIISEAPGASANALTWASRTFTERQQVAAQVWTGLLVRNKDATVDVIQSLTDTQLQAAITQIVIDYTDKGLWLS